MRLHPVFHGTIPKSSRADDPNEDIVRPAQLTEARLTRVALSDGASESYDSRTLAEVVCENWIAPGHSPRLRLKPVLEEFERRSDLANLGWARAAAYERGSFATLLGVFLNGNRLFVEAMGDSMVQVRDLKSGTARMIPYQKLEDVPARPLLISSVKSQNSYYRPSLLKAHHWKLAVNPGDRLMMMTDALALWLLSEVGKERTNILDAIREQADFEQLILESRECKTLKDDDTTLLHLEVIDD